MQDQTETTVQEEVKKEEVKKEIFTVSALRNARAVANRFKAIPSPFGYACLRSADKIDAALKKYDQEITDKQRELALTHKDGDKKGCYVTSMNPETGANDLLNHTPDALRKINELSDSQKDIEVDYTPYYAKNFTEVKGNLQVLEFINGIIIERINLEDYVNSSVIS